MAASGTKNYTMAAEAAAEIVLQKIEILLSRPEWVGCLTMETLMEEAKANLATIREFFSTQDRMAKSTEWSGRLLQALYDAEEFIDKFYLKVARGRHEALHVATRPLATLVRKYILWRDLSNLVKVMKELCQDQYLTGKKEAGGGERKNEPVGPSSKASAPWEGQKLARLTNFWDRQASTNLFCHEAEKEDIKKRFGFEFGFGMGGICGISILGDRGTGKTFLARQVYGEAMYLGCDMRAWVLVSSGMDKQELLFEILKQVDKLARDVMDFQEIRKMLSQKLTKKRFLIVLDDVRPFDEELLQVLMMTIPFSSHGLIITTTTHPRIAWTMNSVPAGPVIKLKELSDKESERMLATKLHRGPHAPRLSAKEAKILNRFPAVPLSISLLGGLLSYAKENERAALENSASKMSKTDLLHLSYHRLPVHLKPCFIYMTLFPLASPISTRRLLRLWLAEGLLDSHCCDTERKRTPEEVAETFILEFADRNMIDVVSWRADVSPKACQMLTSMNHLICPLVMSTGFLHVQNASKSEGRNFHDRMGQQQQQLPDAPRERTKVRWLAEHTNIVRDGRGGSYPDLNLGHIRSFLSFYLRRGILSKDIGIFLRNMTSKADYSLLRVLDLEGVYKPSLQGVLHKLVLLRYLGLRSTVLDSIPSEVADLYYLETLDIKHTNITSLPSSLWKARHLRHLHLNWFYVNLKKILEVCRNNAMALTQLQTFSGLVIGEVKENLMAEPMDSLTTLTTLKLFLQNSEKNTSGAAGEMVARWISFRLTNLQSLTFGVIQEAKHAEEAEPAGEAEEEAQSLEEAQPAKQAEPAKVADPTEVAQPAEEAQPVEEAEPAKEATKEPMPMEEAEPAQEAKPATSQIGPLPELSLAKHHQLFELYLLGRLYKPIIWTQLLPGSLRVLTLSGSQVKTDVMPELGRLLRNLRTLRLLANSFLCKTMSFVKDGFPSLQILKIWKLPQLVRLSIQQGAMLHLKELEFRHLDTVKIVDGIDRCAELEIICVVATKGAPALVEHLNGKKGEWTTVYLMKDTTMPEFMDDTSRDEDEGEGASP